MTWEFQFLNWIQNTLRSELMDKIMPIITKFGDGGIFWIVLTLLLFIPKRTRKYAHVSAFALIFCVVGGNLILKNVIARPRPFWIENGNPLAMIGIQGNPLERLYVRDSALVVPEGRTIIQLLVKAPTDFAFPSGASPGCTRRILAHVPLCSLPDGCARRHALRHRLFAAFRCDLQQALPQKALGRLRGRTPPCKEEKENGRSCRRCCKIMCRIPQNPDFHPDSAVFVLHAADRYDPGGGSDGAVCRSGSGLRHKITAFRA